MSQKVVSIAGATGFVGTAIRNSLVEQYTVRGLTRSAYKMKHPNPTDPVKWIHCDAYDLDSVTKALAGADILIYLSHSMVPSSRLTQASFQDLDLLIADNFAKSAKAVGVKQIIYVGGLMLRTMKVKERLLSTCPVGLRWSRFCRQQGFPSRPCVVE